MNKRTARRLTHNPFAPPKEGFFAGGDRDILLEHLRHSSQWSAPVLVVSGEPGMGKSTLFRELSANLEPQTKATRIAGTLVKSERQVLSALLQGFGAPASSNADADELAELLVRHVQTQGQRGHTSLIMADDAHLFEQTALWRLLTLAAAADLRMVLFAETGLLEVPDLAAKPQHPKWSEICLTDFQAAAVLEYLAWRLRQAGYRGRLPFTQEQLADLCLKSGGNPGVIDSISSNLLVAMQNGELPQARRGLTVVHSTLAGLLVVLLGLVYIFVQPATPLPSGAQEEVVSASAATSAQAAGETDSVAAEAAEVTEVTEVTEVAEVTEGESIAAAPPATAAPNPAVPELPQSTQAPATGTSPEPGAAVPVVTGLRTHRDSDWLLAQNGALYTLQIVTVSARQSAVELINRQHNPAEFAIYQLRRNGQTLYVVTYGLFSDSKAAVTAAAGLDGELAALQAWARPLHLIHDAIRAGTPST